MPGLDEKTGEKPIPQPFCCFFQLQILLDCWDYVKFRIGLVNSTPLKSKMALQLGWTAKWFWNHYSSSKHIQIQYSIILPG